jgi:hypothetical protein
LPARVILVLSVMVNTRLATFFVLGSTTATSSSRTSRVPPLGCAYLAVFSATTVPLCVTSCAEGSVGRTTRAAAARSVDVVRRRVLMAALYRGAGRARLTRVAGTTDDSTVMLRRLGAAVAVLAVLYGCSAAPYTHAHHAIDSARDERHPHGETLVHTHASPHSRHGPDHPGPDPDGSHDSDEQIWSVDGFVFQQPVPSHPPSPVLLVFGEPHVQLTSSWLGADRPQPTAHGPPVGSPSGLRAPPALLPAFA